MDPVTIGGSALPDYEAETSHHHRKKESRSSRGGRDGSHQVLHLWSNPVKTGLKCGVSRDRLAHRFVIITRRPAEIASLNQDVTDVFPR